MMKIPNTPRYFWPKLASRLKIPLIKNPVEKIKAKNNKAVWTRWDLMKHNAVIGKNIVRLYPYMHISYILTWLHQRQTSFLQIFSLKLQLYRDSQRRFRKSKSMIFYKRSCHWDLAKVINWFRVCEECQ